MFQAFDLTESCQGEGDHQISCESVEHVLEHVRSSCKVSLESGSNAPETWSEVELLEVGFVDADASNASDRG